METIDMDFQLIDEEAKNYPYFEDYLNIYGDSNELKEERDFTGNFNGLKVECDFTDNSEELKVERDSTGKTIISNGSEARIFVGNISVGPNVDEKNSSTLDAVHQAYEVLELVLILLIFFVIFKIAELYC